MQKRAFDKRRGSARERGYTRDWEKFRYGFLSEHPLCLYCETQGRLTPAEICDHIMPHEGDPDRFWPPDGVAAADFFAPCCKACHDGPKQEAERHARRTGRSLTRILKDRGMLPPEFPPSPFE